MFARKRLKDSDRTILTQKQEGFGFSDYAFRGRSGEREFVIPAHNFAHLIMAGHFLFICD